MASGDFADLKLQLAYLSGLTAVSQFSAGDQALAGQCVNEALLDIHLLPGDTARGQRPGWALRTFGIQFRAPITATVGVTQGSKVITGYAFPADVAGSTFQLGSNFYTYAGQSGSDHLSVEPIQEATGSYSITLWHHSYPLDAAYIEVQQAPIVQGWGVLAPFASRNEDFRWRQISPFGDIGFPYPSGAGLISSLRFPNGITYPTGTPIYYRVDNSPLYAGQAIKAFFMVQPMPTEVTNVTLKGWATPTELSADADLPVLPANLITRVLIPLIREKWALIYKKYTGDNLEGLIRSADGARQILANAGQSQRDKPVRTRVVNA